MCRSVKSCISLITIISLPLPVGTITYAKVQKNQKNMPKFPALFESPVLTLPSIVLHFLLSWIGRGSGHNTIDTDFQVPWFSRSTINAPKARKGR